MNNCDQYEEAATFGKDVLALVILGVCWFVVTLAVEFSHVNFFQGNNGFVQLTLFLIVFGSAHWRYSKAISYLYNLNKQIVFFAPSISEKGTKRLGQFFTLAGLLVFLFLVLSSISG